MAKGYDLKEATYVSRSFSDDEMWSAFTYLFSSKSYNDTSYKFGFLDFMLPELNMFKLSPQIISNRWGL